MKVYIQIFLFLFVSLGAKSQDDTLLTGCLQLIDKKVPDLQKTTIDGKRIDSAYFKGKITILTFFGFGCGPCYQELTLLDELSKTLDKEKYQILLLGDAGENDLRDFRSHESKHFAKRKRKLGIDTLAFDIVADCPENPVRLMHKSCKGSTEIFKAYAFPTTYFINREGIIKQVCLGFSLPRSKNSDEYFLSKLRDSEH
jgi:peroxiredoxin